MQNILEMTKMYILFHLILDRMGKARFLISCSDFLLLPGRNITGWETQVKTKTHFSKQGLDPLPIVS